MITSRTRQFGIVFHIREHEKIIKILNMLLTRTKGPALVCVLLIKIHWLLPHGATGNLYNQPP